MGTARVRRHLAVVGVLALASLATACGGGDDSAADDSTPAPTLSGTTVTTSTAATTTTTDAATTTVPADTGTTDATSTTIADTTTTDATSTTIADTTATDATPTTAPADTGATDGPVDHVLVSVYWGWDVVNPPAGSPERIGAGARKVAADVPVGNSLEALFAGPDDVERSIGMVTSIPPGTNVLGIAVDGETATVDLSGEFTTSSGSLDETMRLAQVVFTVTQFDGFERVKFHVDGEPQDVMLSHGFEVGDGLTRDDFPEVRPTILIEQPYPGAEVSNPLALRGESNTFEATVRYAITTGGGDGIVVVEGFTTATAGMGTWGEFEVVVDLTDHLADYQPGAGSVVMWEDSPRDGSRVGVVEIPIVLPEL